MSNYNLVYILSSIICKTFMSACGKFQSKKDTPKAFVIRFNSNIDYEKEEGYRWVYLALYAQYNYVSVYTREAWNVIPIEDLEYDEEIGESYVKKGKNYNEGHSDWKLLMSHDSCWRDAVKEFLFQNADVIDSVGIDESFYALVDAAEFQNLKKRN